MLYLNPSRFAVRLAKSDDTQFINYLEACGRNPLLSDYQKRQWISMALEKEAQRDDPRKPRIAKMNQKRQSLKTQEKTNSA